MRRDGQAASPDYGGLGEEPSITIITPSLNRGHMIEAALDSVQKQNYPKLNHIVVDGLSTDDTVERLTRRTGITLIREADRNLYDALNRGLQEQLGDIVGFVNTDDRLADGALQRVARLFREHRYAEMVTGAMAIEHPGGESAVFDDRRFYDLQIGHLINGPTLTNSRFFTRTLLDRVGRFDTRFPLVSDRDFLIRVMGERPKNVACADILYIYGSHAGSLTMSPAGRSRPIAADMRLAAITRANETRGLALNGAYRRWAAWACSYEAALQFSDAPSIDAAWRAVTAPLIAPLGFIGQFAVTLRDRKARLGKRTAATS